MTNKKSTKKALLTSVLCLVLCCSMLIGTTFAWFTDEVKSGTNKILAGNLDVEVYNGLDTNAPKVDTTTKLFDEITYWEPGVVAYENLTVANLGTLALKYQLSVNFDNATTNPNGDTLAKVLKVGFVEDGISGYTNDAAGREALVKKLTDDNAWLPLESFVQSGKLDAVNRDLTDANTVDTYGIVIYWQPSDKDNDYNMNNENRGTVLSIDLGINLVATQLVAEDDSFGPDYDGDALACDILATPETINEILATVESGTVIGLSAGVYGTITLTKNDLTLVSNSAVVGQLDLNEKDGITVDGLTFNAATAQVAYNASGKDSGYVANLTDGKSANGGSVGVVIKNCAFIGTADDSTKYIPVYFGDTGRSNRSDDITIENCEFQTNALQYIALNGVTNNSNTTPGKIVIKNNIFGGNGFGTSHNTINATGQTCDWTIIGNKFNNWNTEKTAIGSSTNGGRVMTWDVIGNEFNNKDGAVVMALKTSYTDANTVVNFADNTVLSGNGTIVTTPVDAENAATYAGHKIQLNTSVVYAATTQELINAIKNAPVGETTYIVLADGNYVMPDGWTGAHDTYNQNGYDDGYAGVNLQNKTLTIIGSRNAVIDAKGIDSRDQFVTGATLTFDGVTVNFGTNNYMGFMNTASLTYMDCAVNGLQFFGVGGPVAFVDCDLNSNGAEHSVWTWNGDKTVSFTGCDFTYSDRAVNCYGEYGTTNISFTNCTFTKVAGKDTTGAIETNSSLMTGLNLTINNCTVSEGDLWWVSTYDNAKGAKTSVTVDGKVTVGTAEQLAAVVTNGANEVTLLAGEYDMPNFAGGSVNGVKFVGTGADTVIKLYNEGGYGDFCLADSTATFENVKIVTEIKDWAGFQSAKNLTFNKCEFENNLFLSGDATFNDCHFVVTTNHYNVWAYSANSKNYTAEFNNCVFDCAGKSIYIDGNAGGSTTMKFTGCTFNDNDGGATDKAAIETGTTYGAGATYNVVITRCEFSGFAINPAGTNTNSTIWANKNSMAVDKLNITIDGVDVY